MKNSELLESMRAEQWTTGSYCDNRGKMCIAGFLAYSRGIQKYELFYLDSKTEVSEIIELSNGQLGAITELNDTAIDFYDAKSKIMSLLKTIESRENSEQ